MTTLHTPSAPPLAATPPVVTASPAALTIPSQLDRARAALARASTDFERLTIRDQAKAYQAAAAILNRRDIQVQASVLVQRAERAISKANPPLPRGGPPDRGKQLSPGGTIAKLRDMRAVHSKLTDKQFEARTVQASESETPLTRQSLKAPQRPRSGNATHDNDDEWYTPPEIIEACRASMGGIDLDPASHAIANRCVKADRYFTAADDGLSQPWAGRVFLNPPYSRQAGKAAFIAKLAAAFDEGTVTAATVVLSYDFSASWFTPLGGLYAAICLCRGRVQFYKETPGDGHDPALGTSLVYLGPDVSRFAQAVEALGYVVIPHGR